MESIIQKRTKIVATIGPASRDPAIMRSLFVCGANVIRLKFLPRHSRRACRSDSHRSRDIGELGIHTALLQDLPGPKVRTGMLAEGLSSVRLERGARFVVTVDDVPGTRRTRRHQLSRFTGRRGDRQPALPARRPDHVEDRRQNCDRDRNDRRNSAATCARLRGSTIPTARSTSRPSPSAISSISRSALKAASTSSHFRSSGVPTTWCEPKRSSPSTASTCR